MDECMKYKMKEMIRVKGDRQVRNQIKRIEKIPKDEWIGERNGKAERPICCGKIYGTQRIMKNKLKVNNRKGLECSK